MFKNKKALWIILIIVAVIALLFYFRFKDNGVPHIKVATAGSGRIESIVSATGMVKAPIYELSSKGGARIASILVKEGQKVKKGQLLVKFDAYDEAKKNFDRSMYLFKNSMASDQSIDTATTMLQNSQMVAPGSGIVAKVSYDNGETPIPGNPVIVIVDKERSWVEAQIDETDMGKITLGQMADITSDVYPDKIFKANIYWISPLAELRKVGERVKPDEESYVFLSKLKFNSPHDELKVNMSANVDILTDAKENAVAVPREAILSEDEKNFVFIIKRNRAYKTVIKTGIRSYSSIEAVSGISNGDVIALSKLKDIKNWSRVIIDQ